jgi:hypothetical protein
VLVPTRDVTQTPTLAAPAKAHGRLHAANDGGSAAQPAASITPLGRGTLAATYFSFSRGYLQERSPKMRGFLNDLVRQLVPKPMIEVKGSSTVDVTVNRLRGKLAIHLVNTSGAHWDTNKPLIDALEPAGPLELAIRLPAKPGRITLQPEGQSLAFEYRDSLARLTVPRLEVHSIVVIE